LKYDGTVVAWGDDSTGQTNVPPGLSNVVAIAAGGFHSMALKSDGNVLAWGDNSTNQTTIPPGVSNVVAISAGYFHSLAIVSPFNVNFTNTPPYWLNTNLPAVTMDEMTTLLVTNIAADADLPPQTLAYSLLNNPLAGASIDPASGLITLSPLEVDGPTNVTLTAVVTDNGSPPLSATNSFTVTVNEVNVAPFWPTNVPSQTTYVINRLTPLVVNNTAMDSDLPVNPLTYQLSGPSGATIDANNGIISWTPTLSQGDTTNVFETVVTDTNVYALANRSLSATNYFTVIVTAAIDLPPDQPHTNTVASSNIIYFAVTVPANADWATNILLFATAPVNVWFDNSYPPTPNVLLLPNITYPSGLNGSVVLGTNTTPPLVPGSTYYLGVQNLNAVSVTFALEVNFHLVPPPLEPIPLSITATNIGGTNGFLLAWHAPTNRSFMVQWTSLLAPLNWQTFTNIITYTGPATPTNGLFTFFDNGSQTGGFGASRYYRLVQLGSDPYLINGVPKTNSIPPGNTTFLIVSVPANASSVNNLLLSATGPVNVWFNQNHPPAGDTNSGDFLELAATNAGAFLLTTNSVPPLVPGAHYFLGIQNPGTNHVTFVFQVAFGFANTNAVSNFGLSSTNGGFWLRWNGQTDYQYQVQWATNLTPPVAWHTVSNVVLTSTTGIFTFFDDGSLTGGFGLMKFYRLIVYPNMTPIPQPLSIASVTVTNLAGTNSLMFQWSALTNYHYGILWTTNLALPAGSWSVLTNPPPALANGIYTFIDNNLTGPPSAGKFYRLVVYP
jgi:hypothetical protein